MPAPKHRAPKRRSRVAYTTVRAFGELLITAGVVVLLFCAYELWFTGIYTAQQQAQLRHELTQQWRHPPASPGASTQSPTPATPAVVVDPPQGDGVAILRIPRLGRDYAVVVVEGVEHEDLKKGPGHYPGTALPGQVGNFVVSGHRTTYGAPFNRLDELRAGDPIVVETRDTWFTYRVTGEQVVSPSAIEVTYPVPGKAGARPSQRLLTFTTCNPKYSATSRLVVRGVLDSALAKSSVAVPPALRGQ